MSSFRIKVSQVTWAASAVTLMVGCGGNFEPLAIELDAPSISSSRVEAGGATVTPRPPSATQPAGTTQPVVTTQPPRTTQPVGTTQPVAPTQPVGTTQPVVPAPPAQPAPVPIASAGSCATDMAQLNWQNLAAIEDVHVTLSPSGGVDFGTVGYPERLLTSTSVQIRFDNPYRLGSSLYFRNSIDYGRDGYRIEFIDLATNAKAVLDASEINYDTGIARPDGQPVAATVLGTEPDATGKFPENRGNNVAWFNVSRSFYSRIQNFGSARVSLYCNNTLIAKGRQDFASLVRGMQNGMKRSIQYSPGKWGYVYDETTPALPATVICPLELKAGASGKCTLDGYLQAVVSGTWFVDGVAVQSFDAKSSTVYYDVHNELLLSNLTVGPHIVQALVRYKDGTEVRSDLRLVKSN